MACMAHRMKTDVGKALYAQPESTIEPVFGITEVMGFCRAVWTLCKVSGQWCVWRLIRYAP